MDPKAQTINTVRLQQLIDLDTPFCGYVDDGFGTVVYIDKMELSIDHYIQNNVFYFRKTVNVHISEVVYTVKKGDNLTFIARRFNGTVEDIVKDNNIKNPDLIYPNEVFTVKTDIQRGYGVKNEIDFSAFASADKSEVNQALSDGFLFSVLNHVNTATDAMGDALKKKAGTSTIGNNMKFYWEKESGRAFQGNKYVKTYGLKGIGNSIKKVTPWIAIGIEVFEVGEGIVQDGNRWGYNATKQTIGGISAVGGAMLGAEIGAYFGIGLGSLCFGAGSIPGAVIGAFVGGFVGAFIGSKLENGAEATFDYYLKDKYQVQPEISMPTLHP